MKTSLFNNKFVKGELVKVPNLYNIVGRTVTGSDEKLDFDHYYTEKWIGVEFSPEEIQKFSSYISFHNLGDRLKTNNGRWVYEKDLVKFDIEVNIPKDPKFRNLFI